jgi:hypothetical protein
MGCCQKREPLAWLLGTATNGAGSFASTTQSWSFAGDCVPKLELGNEKDTKEGLNKDSRFKQNLFM